MSLSESFASLLRLLQLLRRYWSGMARNVVLGVALAALGLLLPLITRALVDNVYPNRDTSLLLILTIGIVAVATGSAFVTAIRSNLAQRISAEMTGALSLLYFNHVQHLPLAFFDRGRVGEITSRQSDIRTAVATLTKVFETVLVSGTYLLAVPPLLLMVNWKLSLLSLLSTPLTSIISVAGGRLLRRHWQAGAEASAQLNATQVDAFTQIRSIKLAGAESAMYHRIADATQEATTLQLRAGRLSSRISFANAIVRALGTALCTWYGWTLILRAELSLGDFLLFGAYLGFMTHPVGEFASLFSDIQRASTSLRRLFEYLDLLPELDPTHSFREIPASITPLAGALEVRAASLTYPSGLRALSELDVAFPCGSATAVVGPSGAGKSSLIRLLAGLDVPLDGEVLLGGRSLRDIDLRSLRSHMAVVWQEAGMVRGTIEDNLTLGARNVTPAQLAEVMRVCRLEDLVASLPRGLRADVSEGGVSLSAGQRQRLALARALLRGARILLLDEATSNIDVVVESEILRDIVQGRGDRTIVFVTHRIVSAQLADRICVMNRGTVLSVASHEQLLESCVEYQLLHAAAHEPTEPLVPRSARRRPGDAIAKACLLTVP